MEQHKWTKTQINQSGARCQLVHFYFRPQEAAVFTFRHFRLLWNVIDFIAWTHSKLLFLDYWQKDIVDRPPQVSWCWMSFSLLTFFFAELSSASQSSERDVPLYQSCNFLKQCSKGGIGRGGGGVKPMSKKNCRIRNSLTNALMFKRKRVGAKAFWKMVKKTARLVKRGIPLISHHPTQSLRSSTGFEKATRNTSGRGQ